MGNRRILAAILGVLAAAIPAAGNAQTATQASGANASATGTRTSDLEFDHSKVTLPAPVDGPWKAAFLDSKSCLDADKKESAVKVLPIWIRKAVADNKPEVAARYLWSLEKLSEDKELPVATGATLAIYRMGDYKGVAAARMQAWIESGIDFHYFDTQYGSSDYKDIRAQVLEVLDLANDRSLDEAIYKVWMKNPAPDAEELASVDYAYYLQQHGRALPADYWMRRLENPYGFEHALEITGKKATPEVTAKLKGLFEQLRTAPAAGPNADRNIARAAGVASLLFRQTKEAVYRDYLMEQARPQLASGAFEESLQNVLDGLAATNDKAALDIVATAMQNGNNVIGMMAIDALGKSQDPAATELLFAAAAQKAKDGKGFPRQEMHALLAQNTPAADTKYKQLQQELLSGKLGWQATASDFDTLEFFQKHMRR